MPCPICGNDAPNCDCTPEERRMHEKAKELLDRVASLEADVPRWIPVAERLPETYDDVLGGHMHEDGSFTYRIAYRQFGTSLMRFYDKHDQMLGVTHWMPLPSPPPKP